jgi:hypothetical protein
MRRTDENFKVKSGGQVIDGIGILLGVVVVLGAVPLFGADMQLSAAGQSSEVNHSAMHVLVISIPDRRLAVTEDGRIVKVYAVAVGASVSPSPTGTLKIINKVANPTYFHSGKVIRPGKSNPLGDRWMGLSATGYGIHGTNAPNSIGKAASHGCIRMGKEDVENLFKLVRVGDVVEIHGQRDERVAETFSDCHASTDACPLKATVSPSGIPSANSDREAAIARMVAQTEGD